jgi:hypothetical protein
MSLFDEYVSLSVERELLIAQGVSEDELTKPLAPIDIEDEHSEEGS